MRKIVEVVEVVEVRATSDGTVLEMLWSVRRQGDFGQSWQKKAVGCPKVRGLRTEWAEKSRRLSEGNATSDRSCY